MDLSSGQDDLQWEAQSIDQRMDFGAQPTFASADRLIVANFFWAPALC